MKRERESERGSLTKGSSSSVHLFFLDVPKSKCRFGNRGDHPLLSKNETKNNRGWGGGLGGLKKKKKGEKTPKGSTPL